MRLTVDDEIFVRKPRGGISRYFVELLRQFDNDPGLGVLVDQPRLWTLNEHLIEAGRGRRMPTSLGRRRRALMAANRLRRTVTRRPDVLHHTYYSRSYLAAYPEPRVRAVTVYDMIPEVLPDLFTNGNPHFDKREFVAAADVILCISENTRRDLERFYGPQSAPVFVTPLAVGSRFSPSATRPAVLPERYILYVGGREHYKDFGTLVDAFAAVAATDKELHLVVVGSQEWGSDEMDRFGALGIAARVSHHQLTDEAMPGAYAHALCYVSTSLYEGFGLPTLEAMASGCPAVLSSTSSHPEVGGDAALYFAPGDSEALERLVRELCSDDERQRHQRSLGLQRAREFSWRRTAELTAQAYRQAGRLVQER